jgi:hypothetical protein
MTDCTGNAVAEGHKRSHKTDGRWRQVTVIRTDSAVVIGRLICVTLFYLKPRGMTTFTIPRHNKAQGLIMTKYKLAACKHGRTIIARELTDQQHSQRISQGIHSGRQLTVVLVICYRLILIYLGWGRYGGLRGLGYDLVGAEALVFIDISL